MKIKALGSITSWQIDGTKTGNSDRLYLLGLQNHSTWVVTATKKLKDSCSLEEKLWQIYKCVLNSRGITLPIKVHVVKTMVFPVVLCESWIIKKAECWRIDAFELWCWRRLCWRIDAFELWCWRRLLRVSRRSNQSILKEINPEYSSEEMMLKLTFQHFGHLMWRADSLKNTLMIGKIEGRRRKGQQRMRWVGWHHRFNGH